MKKYKYQKTIDDLIREIGDITIPINFKTFREAETFLKKFYKALIKTTTENMI